MARWTGRSTGAGGLSEGDEEGRLLVLSKPNGGKAEALNLGLNHVEEEIYVGIDADTVIARDAVSKLVRLLPDPRVGAVAGNARWATASTCGRGGRRSNTSRARTSSGGRWICSTW